MSASSVGWWQPTADRPPPPPQLAADAVVIGLGGTGLAAIHRLLDHGLRVVGIDRRLPGEGAAGRNGGLLLAGLAQFHHHARARWGAAATDLYRMTLEVLDRLVHDHPDQVRRTGSMRVEADAAGRDDLFAHADALSADHLPGELRPDGLFLPSDACTDPFALVQRQALAALHRGAELFRAPASLTDRGVEGSGWRILAPLRLVCADAASGRWLPDDHPDPIQPVRLQMLTTAPLPRLISPTGIYARRGMDYWQQTPDGRLFLGGRRDAGGPQERTDAEIPSSRVQADLDALLATLATTARVTHRWAGVVGYTASGLPCCDLMDPSLDVTGGYNGTGNLVGRLCGEALADQLVGAPSPWAKALRAARGHAP